MAKKYLGNRPCHYVGQSELMTKNARKANRKRNPDGYIYIIKLSGHHLYKIGVSKNPKKRLADIDSALPFPIEKLGQFYFKDVYNMEENIHDSLEENKYRREWFLLREEDVKIMIKQIQKWSDEGLFLIPIENGQQKRLF